MPDTNVPSIEEVLIALRAAERHADAVCELAIKRGHDAFASKNREATAKMVAAVDQANAAWEAELRQARKQSVAVADQAASACEAELRKAKKQVEAARKARIDAARIVKEDEIQRSIGERDSALQQAAQNRDAMRERLTAIWSRLVVANQVALAASIEAAAVCSKSIAELSALVK
jgi:hypothetical protein